jgi:hypothetical protein
MPRVVLELRPDVCGTVSVGTVAVIRVVARCLDLSLDVAAGYVSQCVFEGRAPSIPAPSRAAVDDLVHELGALGSPLEPSARLVMDRAD